MTESHLRSVIKGISWRIIGTLDTMMISFCVQYFHLIPQQPGTKQASHGEMASNAMLIGLIELFTKVFLYYVHERIWLFFLKDKEQTKAISISKAVSWRIVGSLDTMLWSGVILKDFQKGMLIGLLEVGTKIILYYFHERAWHRLPIGSVRRWFGMKKQD
ncbi:MAG: DUF2061 domain-containing protein [Chitinophagales bacterium]